ncbi:MAG: ABC transporter permease [Treponema sp.]|uniref:ABC transporter permease n=1 Tax=Treponema sp. TaxID=166 RepID=UPI003FA1BCBF
MKYIRLYVSFLRINLIREFQFRVHLLFYFVTISTGLFANILFYHFLYESIDTIAGWTKYEIFILVATVIIINSLFGGMFFFNLIRIPQKVKTYDLDYLLLKPVNTIFYISCRDFNGGLFLGSFFGLGLLLYSIVKLGLPIKIQLIIGYIFLIGCSVLLLYCILFFMITFSLRFVKINGLIQIFWSIVGIGNNPHSIYPTVINCLGVSIIPSIIIYNFPAIALTENHIFWGLNLIKMCLFAFVITILFLYLVIRFFYRNLTHYYT